MGVFNQRFEALFPRAGARGCEVCFAPPPFLPVYLCANVGTQGLPATTLWGLLAAAWPAPFHNPPPRWVCQPPPCCESSLTRLPVSAPPTGLDECLFFPSLVSDFLAVGFSLSSGCARRRSVSTYTTILVLSICSFSQWLDPMHQRFNVFNVGVHFIFSVAI